MRYLVEVVKVLTYGRKNLKFVYRNGVAYPYYMDVNRDESLVTEVIKFYEDNVGKKYSDIDWDELRIIVGDDRVYNAIRRIMTFFYRHKPKDLTSINPKLLRIRVFQLVNKLYGGFIPSNVREEALIKIKNLLGIQTDINLDEILWVDDLDEAILIKVREPSIEEVVKLFNFETIDTICTNAYGIFIEIKKGEALLGNLSKTIGRLSKFYGVIYDARYDGSLLRFSFDGPRSLFRRSMASYGSRISLILSSVIPTLYTLGNWTIYAFIGGLRKTKLVILSNKLKPYISHIDKEHKVKEVFDSSIEESIFNVLKSLGVDIRREEEPIALGDIFFIPDFKVCKNRKCFYIEVIGYWRKEYIEKKMYKLSEVSKIINRILIIADERLKQYLDRLKIPIIYYTVIHGKPVLNYRRVLELLNSNYKDQH